MTADPGGFSARPRISSDDIDRLFRAKGALLFGIAFRILGNREDAEDTVQNAWIKAMLPWPDVDSTLETLDEQCAFMITVVVNGALQRIRERHRRRESFGTDPKEDPRIIGLWRNPAGAREISDSVSSYPRLPKDAAR